MGSIKGKLTPLILIVVAAAVIWSLKIRRASVPGGTTQPTEREIHAADYKPFQAECERGHATEQQFATSVKLSKGSYGRTDRMAFEERVAEVRPGMEEEQVVRIAGKPSYVLASWHNDTELMCYWKYVLSGHQQGREFIFDDVIEIAFDRHHRAMTAADTWQRIDPSVRQSLH